jgi:hypothetical protein
VTGDAARRSNEPAVSVGCCAVTGSADGTKHTITVSARANFISLSSSACSAFEHSGPSLDNATTAWRPAHVSSHSLQKQFTPEVTAWQRAIGKVWGHVTRPPARGRCWVGGLLGGLDVLIGTAMAMGLAIGRSDVFSLCCHTARRTRGTLRVSCSQRRCTKIGEDRKSPSRVRAPIGAQPRAGFARFDVFRRAFWLVGGSALLGTLPRDVRR